MKGRKFLLFGFGLILALGAMGFGSQSNPSLVDDAGGRKPSDFPELAIDVFKPMDGGITLTEDEIKGRNTWNLWCAGNEQFWERMAREGYGLFDLLKTIDSRNRGTRFKDMGLINEPGFRKAAKPDAYGLWIDEPIPGKGEPAGIDPKVYGRPSGIMGIRIFDNPEFKGDAVAQWSADRYYNDQNFAVSRNLVRPYRVGVSCGVCHIAFNPCNPPSNPENPKWSNLVSVIGNQYIREGKVFAPNVKPGGLFWEMLKAQPAGTSDTSRIATDHINNPNAINSIFRLGDRLAEAQPEELGGESALLPTNEGKTVVNTPHVLKDGADSVGVPGAFLRVFINIGSYSQHWLQQHNALLGLTHQKPFSIKTAKENSVYWLASETKFMNVAKFFMRLEPFHLAEAPGGKGFMTKDSMVLNRGKMIFAENCAQCHSSKQPPSGLDPDQEADWFHKEIMKPDFEKNNFFSDDKRKSILLIQTNSARACGTNAMRGHIWANFSSETYKKLPSVGAIDVWNPFTEETEKFQIPGGGPGYYRTPSLISCWATAPFFHNNALGKYTGDPSVKGRMEAFNDAVEKLLWPEKRDDTKSIWRISQECSIQIQLEVIPEPLKAMVKTAGLVDPDGYFRLGPIPKGTPLNLLANIDPDADPANLVKACVAIKKVLLTFPTEEELRKMDPAKAQEIEAKEAAAMKKDVAPALWKISKCRDFVEDRGHYFGTRLPDSDKKALIEYLKTL